MKGSYTHDVEQHAEWELSKNVSFYLIPTWLQEALDANKLTGECLSDREKLKTILTVEDVKFYNSQVKNFLIVQHRIGFLSDVYPTLLAGIFPSEQCYSEPLTPGIDPLYENTVSIKDAVSPFISESSCNLNPNVLSALYPIFNFSIKRDKVFITFGLADPSENASKIKESYEKFATFLIGEYGIKCTAQSEVFKKILENKINY